MQWLYEELPDLVGKGVLPAETAEKLRQHYGEVEAGGGKRWAIILFGILGGALIGAGVILLLAHNWDEFSRPVRAALSFVPLVAAQALASYVLWKHRTSTAWREGVGTFWTLSIGASIALVAQTYNISGDFAAFMLTWSLAALPVVYLLNASAPAMLYWVGVATWAGNIAWRDHTGWWFWPLAALAVPHLWWLARENRYRPRVGLLLWVLTVCGSFGVGFSMQGRWEHTWMPVFASYYAALYLAGSLWFEDSRAFWQRPLQTVGALGVMVLAIVLTFGHEWRHLLEIADWQALLRTPLAIWPVAALALWVHAWTRREPVALLFGAFPVIVLIGTSLNYLGGVSLVLMNLYVLGLGVTLIALGVRDRRLGVVNLGMLVTSALIVARFFDSDMSFVLRGLAFITVGTGFLVTNIVLLRRKGAA